MKARRTHGPNARLARLMNIAEDNVRACPGRLATEREEKNH